MLTSDTQTAIVETPEAEKPRLLSMRQAAAYLGCSFWTARDYVIQGLIPSMLFTCSPSCFQTWYSLRSRKWMSWPCWARRPP